MERDRGDDETQSSAKRLKLDEKEEHNENQMAVANVADDGEEENIGNANDGSPPSIFKLDIDCCEELFAYLPLEALHSLGQTCKRMHQFTGYFVRENYKSTKFEWKNGNLCLYDMQMNGFIEFISYLHINFNKLDRFAEFAPRFKSVRKVRLYLKNDQIDCIKEILQKCEEIDLSSMGLDMLNIDLYEKILKFCTNLKHFKLNSSSYNYGVLKNNNWLSHEYPNLDFLDLYSNMRDINSPIDEIKTFFTLNKEIRKFQTNFRCFWNYRHWIVDTDIKLDELLVNATHSLDNRLESLNREHINLLNMLYERDFYKHLSLNIRFYDSSILAEIRAPLTMEFLLCGSPLPSLDLKELRLHHSFYKGDLKTFLANNHSTIERLHFYRLKTENVLFFVKQFMKLREIKTHFLSDVNSLNLVTLNEERKKLIGATCVTIYLSRIYFNQVIKISNLELIKIKLLNHEFRF